MGVNHLSETQQQRAAAAAAMSINKVNTPYPLIDADPHFNRVVRYMRPSDYAAMGVFTLGAPAAIYGYQMADPAPLTRGGLRGPLRLATFLGLCGGFLFAYQNSSKRFWGWTENEREQKMDHEELSARAKAGLPLYGETDLPEYIQGVAHRNSLWSQLKFSAIPWFNVVNHPHHGVDTKRYYESKDE